MITCDLRERIAVVTGASSGLGDRFARVLHANGATVVVAARRADRLDALAAELGGRIVPVPTDVRSPEACEALVEAALGMTGHVDVLVNNAGTAGPDGPTADLDSWDDVMAVNVRSTFLLSKLVGTAMCARGQGSIVNVASMFGTVASAPINQASYCASKGAVVNLTRELACQWARRGVRVNALAPGFFESEMTSTTVLADERTLRHIERSCPMGRIGAPGELDGALLFLAGGASTYVTGQVLTVDGGWSAR